jgi:hypothetical protein
MLDVFVGDPRGFSHAALCDVCPYFCTLAQTKPSFHAVNGNGALMLCHQRLAHP